MIKDVIFSDKQGGGYITDTPEIFEHRLKMNSIVIDGQVINPGDRTDLKGFFCKPFLYVGYNEETQGSIFRLNESIWQNGKLIPDPLSTDLRLDFDNYLFYYQEVFVITETRIFLIYKPNGGRDWNLIKGRWK